MSIKIVFIDGEVRCGKTTFLMEMKKVLLNFGQKVECVDEPLKRDWTERIVKVCGYETLLNFVIARKNAAICSQLDLFENVNPNDDVWVLVERSFVGDLCVRGMLATPWKHLESARRITFNRNSIYVHLESGSDSPEEENLLRAYDQLVNERTSVMKEAGQDTSNGVGVFSYKRPRSDIEMSYRAIAEEVYNTVRYSLCRNR